jgi:hypothetical protein
MLWKMATIRPDSNTAWHIHDVLAGLLDPSSGEFTRIPVDYKPDYHVLNSQPDGKVLGLALSMQSKVCKFQPVYTR